MRKLMIESGGTLISAITILATLALAGCGTVSGMPGSGLSGMSGYEAGSTACSQYQDHAHRAKGNVARPLLVACKERAAQ